MAFSILRSRARLEPKRTPQAQPVTAIARAFLRAIDSAPAIATASHAAPSIAPALLPYESKAYPLSGAHIVLDGLSMRAAKAGPSGPTALRVRGGTFVF